MPILNPGPDTVVSCCLCGGTSARKIFAKDGYNLAKCRTCGLVYVSNPPGRSDLEILYSFQSDYHTDFKNDDAARAQYIGYAENHYAFVAKYLKPGRLLDIGCSAGFFLKVARDNKWMVEGLELSNDTAELARRLYSLNVKTGRLGKDIYPPDSFDLVTLWDVIEHDLDPAATMQYVHAILHNGGFVVLSTPNINGLFPTLAYPAARFTGKWLHVEPPHHLFQFSVKTIGRLLQEAGFTIVSIQHERIPISYTFGTWKTLPKSMPRLIYSMVFAPLAWLGPYLRAGDEIIIAAKKI